MDALSVSAGRQISAASPQQAVAHRMRRPLAIAASVAAIALAAWLAQGDPAASGPAADSLASASVELAAADTALVELKTLSRALPISGSMAPLVQATVKSKVSGEVQEVTVREGQGVTAGEIIARVDSRNLQAQYDRERAAVEKAVADRDIAALNRDKNRRMLELRFIPQSTYEASESVYAGSVASVKLAEAQARLARIGLEDAVIRAPFAGTISKRLVQPGEKVSADTPVAAMVDLRKMVLEAAIPAAEVPGIQVGQPVHFAVGGFGAREFRGEVERINPAVNDASRSIAIYIAVDNADSALKGGMFAQGELLLESTLPVLSIPLRGVRNEAGVPVAYVVSQGRVDRRAITTGPMIEGQDSIEIRTGLAEGDRVVLGDIRLEPGTAATVRSETRSGT